MRESGAAKPLGVEQANLAALQQHGGNVDVIHLASTVSQYPEVARLGPVQLYTNIAVGRSHTRRGGTISHAATIAPTSDIGPDVEGVSALLVGSVPYTVRRIITVGQITDDQIKAIYDHAAKLKVIVGPWQDHLDPDRSRFKWAVNGGPIAVAKMIKYLKTYQ